MKNLLCIALFSVALLVNAAEEKEIVMNNFEDITTEPISFENELMGEIMFFGCGSQANSMYNEYRASGMNHREARSERRAWVRDCRGFGPNGWWSIGISFR